FTREGLVMFRNLLRRILGNGQSQSESYYQSILQFANAEVAPSMSEARADYMRRSAPDFEYRY
ncbi:MAG: hypothetical protein ACYC4L_08045, partial [Chloroflexota bacterium]